MNHKLSYILFAALIGVIGFSAGIYSRNTKTTRSETAEVTVDGGDTVVIKSNRLINYIGINAPELDEKYGTRAAELNNKLVEGKEVRYEYEPTHKIDKDGSLLAYTWVKPDIETLTNMNEQGEVLANVELVRQGLARVISYDEIDELIYQDILLEAENLAKEEKLGIWSE